MNIINEFRSIKTLSKNKQRALAVFYATLLCWTGMGIFAPENPYAFWSVIPVLLGVLYLGYIADKEQKEAQK